MKNVGKIVVGIFVLAVLAAIGFLYLHTGSSSANTINYQPIFLTDPPSVPAETSALIINYSLLEVNINGSAGSGLVMAPNGSGSINLLAATNSSQLMGVAVVPAAMKNATINEVRFSIFSASITINGTTTNVIVPNRDFTVYIVGRNKLNSTTGVIIDFSPTIITIYGNSSTEFALVPSARGIVVANATLHAHVNSRIGEKVDLDNLERARIDSIRPNITITSASLSTLGNSTSLSITVKDNSNQSVMLHNLIVFGNESVHTIPFNEFNSIVRGRFGLGIGGSEVFGMGGIGTWQNESTNTTPHNNFEVQGALSVGIVSQSLKVLNFLIADNGTLVLPRTRIGVDNILQQNNGLGGYNLNSGSSTTFTFNGPISYGFGHVTIESVAGDTYRLVVSGEEGARATANLIAT